MGWATAAQTLLDAAVEAGPPVSRTFIAPGPRFAHDCSLIAVHLAGAGTESPGGVGQIMRQGGGCLLVPYADLVVTFVMNCVPTGSDNAGTWTPPPTDDVTAWSTAFLDGLEAIMGAVLDAADGTLAEECLSAVVGDLEPAGPSGGVAWATIPVRVAWAP